MLQQPASSWQERVRALVESGADVEPNSPALVPTPENIARELNGILEVKFQKSAALCKAAWYGHSEVVQLLAEKGADLSAGNDDGSDVLHLMASKGHVA